MSVESENMKNESLALLEIQAGKRYYTMGENIIRAMDGIDVKILPGEFVMIVGSSGSGKSTLMHTLGFLDKMTEGRYLIRGQDASQYSDEQLSAARNRRIGFVFQQFNLLSDLTVLENIALPLTYSGISTAERLEMARRQALALGLKDRIHHRPTELSGGQAQRVAIARALVHEPLLVLADEPTGNLDEDTGQTVLALLLELTRDAGKTLVMATHAPAIVPLTDRVCRVHHGHLILEQAALKDVHPA